jgi:AraC-like DNA-binding protein
MEDGETLDWLRPAALPGVEWLVAERSARRWHAFHENYVICPVEMGDADYRYRGKIHHLLLPNGFMLMEPGETHVNITVRRPADFKALFILPEIVANAARELGIAATPHFRVPQGDNPVFFQALWQFHAASERGETALEQQSRFAVCLRFLLEHYTERAARTPHDTFKRCALERARACLQERFNESVSLDELSAVAGLSRFHLLRAFKKRFGVPPHTYQLHARIARARVLLQKGVSPADTASSVGFADQSHFTRHFKRILGVTPGQYARAAR